MAEELGLILLLGVVVSAILLISTKRRAKIGIAEWQRRTNWDKMGEWSRPRSFFDWDYWRKRRK